MNPEYDVS